LFGSINKLDNDAKRDSLLDGEEGNDNGNDEFSVDLRLVNGEETTNDDEDDDGDATTTIDRSGETSSFIINRFVRLTLLLLFFSGK
jgi:hypothetical protein